MKTLVVFFILASCAFTAGQAKYRFKRATGWDVYSALNSQNTAEAIRLIESGIEPTVADGFGQLPMHYCSKFGFANVAQLLIDKGYKNQINQGDQWGDTPMHEAASRNTVTVLEILLKNGGDVNKPNNFGKTPLGWAAERGHENAVQLLLNYGANGKEARKLAVDNGHNKIVELLDAAAANNQLNWNGQESQLRTIIESGNNVNARDSEGKSIMHLAAINGFDKIVALLIDKGYKHQIHSKTGAGDTPLHWAVWNGYENIVNKLIQAGSDVNIANNANNTPLQWAAWAGRENIARILVQSGSKVDYKNAPGYIPLHDAAKHGHGGVVKFLIESGSDVNAKDNIGWTPLHLAASFGHENVARILIQSGSRINEKTTGNWTPIQDAAYYGFDKIVELLLSKDADINHKNNEGQKARDIAAQRGHKKIVDLLDRAARIQNKGKINKYIEKVCERYSSERPTDFILEGRPARPEEFPWMAALGYFNARTNAIDYRCGGTIISEHFVLTAAHCTKLDQPPVVVRLGTIYLTDSRDVKTYFIKDIIRHEDYSVLTKKNDIALLRLSKEIQFTPDIRPACLETDAHDLGPNVALNVSGWGSTSADNDATSDKLLTASVQTMALSECNTTYLKYNEKVNHAAFRNGISDSQYCAYDPVAHRDSCRGDSGGPLQIFRNSHASHVVGIVSFGVSCGSTLPGIYTRVAYYTDWIAFYAWPDAATN